MRELARLATKAQSEQARIAAINEILDRGYGRPGETSEEPKPPQQQAIVIEAFRPKVNGSDGHGEPVSRGFQEPPVRPGDPFGAAGGVIDFEPFRYRLEGAEASDGSRGGRPAYDGVMMF